MFFGENKIYLTWWDEYINKHSKKFIGDIEYMSIKNCYNKWMNNCFKISPTNKTIAEKGIKEIYKALYFENSPAIVWFKSPFELFNSMDLLNSIKSFRYNIEGKLIGNMLKSFYDYALNYFRWNNDKVVQVFCTDIRINFNNVLRLLNVELGKSIQQKDFNLIELKQRIFFGQNDYIFPFVDYHIGWKMDSKKFLSNTDGYLISGLYDIAMSAGMAIFFRDICFISERYNVCKYDENYNLHCERGPAIQYPDGFSVYSLNGLLVDKYIVETPGEQMDSKVIFEYTNAETRREIVKKIGVEKLCHDLRAKIIDKKDSYELLSLDLKDGRYLTSFKMSNASMP